MDAYIGLGDVRWGVEHGDAYSLAVLDALVDGGLVCDAEHFNAVCVTAAHDMVRADYWHVYVAEHVAELGFAPNRGDYYPFVLGGTVYLLGLY